MDTKNNKLPSIVSILILTVLTSLVWIFFSVYRAITAKPAPIVPQVVSQPLSPALDTTTLNQIQSSIFLDNSQIPQTVGNQTSAPTPTTTTVPKVTSIASPSATPEVTATPSATP